jgi:hypothetical protein
MKIPCLKELFSISKSSNKSFHFMGELLKENFNYILTGWLLSLVKISCLKELFKNW